MPMKLLFIVAPTVSGDVREALRTSIHESERACGAECEIVELTPDHSIPETVGTRIGGVNAVVAVGGDGTVSAVAHALADASVPLGIVAAGTGNLVARELGIPL
ncbi:MAG TPA: acylglycerol kinase family protein, partial [Kiritimatiellia bacterium]|nr:acylglycerol kinase family protein [Kiritimatiellia bacterium]